MSLIVVTDLDGTLLDHKSYSFEPALPAIEALKEGEIPLILASSKTWPEIEALQKALGIASAPAIVENGAGVVGLGAAVADCNYARLRGFLDAVPRHLRGLFRGFGDMSVQEIADQTELTTEAAALAKQRAYSEPGLWHGSEAEREAFEKALKSHGIGARRGGRFLTLSFGRTKADAMSEVARALKASTILALGDAPNDIEMLETADFGVIVRNDHGAPMPALDGEATGRIRRTSEQGPEGWRDAVLGVLDELQRSERI